MTEKEMAVIDAEARTITPMSLIERAQNDASTSIEKMEQLFELQLRWEQNEGKKAYFDAFAAFKAETVKILKDKKVGYTNKDGSFTGYSHATIGAAVNAIVPVLAKHGLSHRWDVQQDNGMISVSCILSHRLGHSESISMTAGKDDSGKKNLIQQIASTVTYLQRYTLLAITGLATEDQQDDDGRGSEDDIEYISESQEADLLSLLSEVKADERKFCVYFKIDSVAHLPAEKFSDAVTMLERKRQ